MKRNLFVALAAVLAATWTAAAFARGTDVKVESKDIDLLINEKSEAEEKFGIPIDEETSLGFNEDGDPALSRRF